MAKEPLNNKVDKIAAGFLSAGEASKRINAMCLASFDNEAGGKKTRQDVEFIFRQFIRSGAG